MSVKIVNRNVAAISAPVSGMLLSGSVLAQSVDAAPGYLKDRSGNIVRTGSGGCAHTGNWTPEMAPVSDAMRRSGQDHRLYRRPGGHR